MTMLTFVCLTRNAGATFADLAHDIAVQTRPGDQVLLIDDGSTDDTPARIGRFTEMEGWGRGVRVTRIITGPDAANTGSVTAQRDAGLAINLALATLEVPDQIPDHVIFLAAGARLDGPAFAAARALLDQHDPDLLLVPQRHWHLDLGAPVDPPDLSDWPAPGIVLTGPAAQTRAGDLWLPLSRMIIGWPLLAGLRCAEDRAGHADLPLCRQVLKSAGHIILTGQPLGHTAHPPDPGPALLLALSDVMQAEPQAADWVRRHLPRQLQGAPAGALTGLLAQGADLARLLASGKMTDPVDHLLAALRAGDTATARPLLRAMMQPAPQTPAITRRAPLRIAVLGPHAHRSPFGHPALAPLWDGAVTLTPDPNTADLILFAHPQDPARLPAPLGSQRIPAALLSEEPFWDTLFSPDPLARRIILPAGRVGDIALHQVTHHRSPIFAFEHIPYDLLTEPDHLATYARLFARNAALGPADWHAAFAARPVQAAFMATRRPEPFHDMRFPAGDITGLCAWRTRLAQDYRTGKVWRLGEGWHKGWRKGWHKGWRPGPPRRLQPDWHRAKIARLDGQARIISGLENTHQPSYLTEKLFDAFACGGRPLYFASPGHRLHDLGLPEAAIINLWGHDSASAAIAIDAARWDIDFCAAYAQAQAQLARMFTTPALIAAERARLGQALLGEVRRLADLGPA